MKFHSEAGLHRINNLSFQRKHILRSSLPGCIDYHKRLVLIYLSAALGFTLEATTLYHPGSRNFNTAVREHIMRSASVRRNGGKLLCTHYRILEKTAGAANFSRIRKFLSSELDYSLTHIHRARRLVSCKSLQDSLVFRSGYRFAAEPEKYAGNDIPALVLLFLEH